jgi:hypothetical protein
MNHHRLGGLVCGVQFTRTMPGEYVTTELDGDQVSLLRGHDGVLIEAMTQPLPVEPLPIWVSPVPSVEAVLRHEAIPRHEPVVHEAPFPRDLDPMPTMSARMPQERPQRRDLPPPVPEVSPPTAEERRAERQRRLAAANKRTRFDKYG